MHPRALVIGRPRAAGAAIGRTALLPFALASFAANSMITRCVVDARLLDPGLLGAMRLIAGALTLAGIAVARRERLVVERATVRPALWLGAYAACISYGYRYIGAAAGTFVFYAAVLATLVSHDLRTGSVVGRRRGIGVAASLGGVAVLAIGSPAHVTVLGVALLLATGVAWGSYTAANRVGSAEPRAATTGHFVLVAMVTTLPATAGVLAGIRLTAAGAAWAVSMGAGTTAIAYVAWYTCQRSMSPTSAGAVQCIIPVLTASGATMFLGEPISGSVFVAAALISAGTWLARSVR
jgi:drug/metabolite transporter (DMT)-like permease